MAELAQVKLAASGRWGSILPSLAGIPSDALDRKNHPCPKCGGTDRFRALNDFEQTGAVFCNQCFSKANGDGVAAIQWATGWTFPESVDKLAEHLGLNGTKPVQPKREVANYRYEDEHGNLLFQVVRYEPKGFAQRRPKPDGQTGWLWNLTGVKQVPYRLPALLAKVNSQVFICEGEKDCDRLAELGLVATTNAGGAEKWTAEHAAYLAGRNVTILPDNDDKGRAHANKVAASLHGIAASVRVLVLPNLPLKGDVSNWLDAGGTVEELFSLDEATPEWTEATFELEPVKPAIEESGPKATSLADAAEKYIQSLRSGKEVLIKTGIPGLDRALNGGVASGEVVVLAARPSHGKTMVAMQCVHQWSREGHKCLVISEEMAAMALGKRMLQFMSDVPEENWTREQSELDEVLRFYRETSAECTVLEECFTVEVVCQQIAKYAAQGVKRIIVDYIQLLGAEGKSEYDRVTNASKMLKACAKQNDVLLILLAQLSREIEKRPKFVPKTSDLRASGQIEQDADVILFLVWPHRIESKLPPNEFLLFVAKNRNRGVNDAVVKCRIEPSRQMLTEERAADMPNYESAFDAWN